MENFITIYFKEEKTGALLLLIVSVVAFLSGAYLYFKPSESLLRSALYPLLLLAIFELVIGAAIYLRTDKQVSSLQAQLTSAPATFKADEIKRMERVNSTFKIVKAVEVVFIIASVLLILLVHQPMWVGIAIGLLVQSVFFLLFDTVAHQRGEKYFSALTNLTV